MKNLVRIKADGIDHPWFFVHPAGGHVHCYRVLAQFLNRPAYGFQAKGLDGKDPILKTIEEMAFCYIASMQQQQPQGPYALAAWSSGCVIAYEMAAQLKVMQQEVSYLVLLDGPSPHDHRSVTDTDLLICFLEDMIVEQSLTFLSEQNFHGADERQQLMFATARLKPRRSQFWDVDALVPIFMVFKSVVRAVRNYYPQKMDLDLALCRTAESLVSEFVGHPHIQRVDWGWGLLTSHKVRCQLIRANHYNMFELPIVKHVARFMNQVGLNAEQLKWRLA